MMQHSCCPARRLSCSSLQLMLTDKVLMVPVVRSACRDLLNPRLFGEGLLMPVRHVYRTAVAPTLCKN